MLKFTLTHTLKCTPDEYWRLFLDPGFTKELLTDGLGFGRVDVGPLKDAGDDKKTRTMKVVPKLDLPAAVARALGEALSYTEEGTFDTVKQRWEFEMTFSVLSDRLKTGGTFYAQPAGSGCKRVAELWIDAKVFGVGSLIERSAKSNMETGFDKSAAFFNRWVDKHGQGDAS